MAYIQVGGKADGAADAAPSPSRFARGRRAKHTSRKPYRIRYGKAHKQGSQKVSENFLGRGAVTAKTGGLRKQSAQKAKFTATTGRGIAANLLGDCCAHAESGFFRFVAVFAHSESRIYSPSVSSSVFISNAGLSLAFSCDMTDLPSLFSISVLAFLAT